MHTAKFVTFIVWGLTAATGFFIALGGGSKNLENAPHIPHSTSATYSAADITQLLSSSATSAANTAVPLSHPLHLLGIVYSTDPTQSRALLGSTPHTAQAYAIGNLLPNGARLSAIAQHSVTLAVQANSHTLELPQSEHAHAKK